MRPRIPLQASLAALFAVATLCAIGAPVRAASSGTVVGATVPSSTSIDALTGCAPGVSGVTSFGPVTPGSALVTTDDCLVDFGSSNASATLRVAQGDGTGAGMWRLPTGELDDSYQGDGIGDEVADATPHSWARTAEAVLQADGKLLAAEAQGDDTRIYRFTKTGSLDATWGTGGLVTVPNLRSAGIAVGSDGKVWLAGQGPSAQARVARLSSSGVLDGNADADPGVSCGAGGITTYAPFGVASSFKSIRLDEARGVGYAIGGNDNGSDNDIAVMQLDLDDCSTVTSFGTGGWVGWDGGDYDDPGASLVMPDGDIVVAIEGPSYGGLLRVRSDGQWETGFATAGVRLIDTTGNDEYTPTLAYDAPRDRLYAVGTRANGCWDCDMSITIDAMDAQTGAAIAGYGTAGRVTVQPTTSEDRPDAAIVDSEGNLVVAGATDDAGNRDLLLARVLPNGELDDAFGSGGVQVHAIDAAANERPEALFEVEDGRLLTIVRRDMGGGTDRLVPVRLATAAIPEYQYGVADWETTGTGHFGICLRGVAFATAAWSTDADCWPSADPWWRGLPTSATAVASTSGPGDATAAFRFGLRTASGQAAGRYVAPVAFTVIAP